MNRPRFLRTLAILTLTLGLSPARADMTAEWVALAATSTQQAAAPSIRLVREAVSAAAAAAEKRHDGATESSDTAAARHDAAVAVAAFVVLEHLYPDQRDELEARLAVSFSHIPENDAKAEGAAMGRRLASEMLAAKR